MPNWMLFSPSLFIYTLFVSRCISWVFFCNVVVWLQLSWFFMRQPTEKDQKVCHMYKNKICSSWLAHRSVVVIFEINCMRLLFHRFLWHVSALTCKCVVVLRWCDGNKNSKALNVNTRNCSGIKKLQITPFKHLTQYLHWHWVYYMRILTKPQKVNISFFSRQG